jgi:hypothetical protein
MNETEIKNLKRQCDLLLEERETWRRTHMTLTEGERTAIVWCVEMAETTATECDEELAALRGLLNRTKD